MAAWTCFDWRCCFYLVSKSYSTLCDTMDCSMPSFPVPHYILEFAQTHVSWVGWCYSTRLFSVIPFSSCSQSFPASRSFLLSQLFASDDQSIGASASGLPMNFQDWFPLGLTGLTSLQSKEFSSIFSSTTIQKYQFFGVQPSLWSNSHIHNGY